MESLESLNIRIEYGRKVDNVSSKVFFGLEPTLRLALINYLQRKHKDEVAYQPLHYMADFELVRLFEEMAKPGDTVRQQINEVHQAITDYRLITFARRHGNNSSVIEMKKENLKDTDYYLTVMKNVLDTLLRQVNSSSTKTHRQRVLANKVCCGSPI
ncbi:MAG TPA: hypothetical protein VJ964_17750 [Balneolaceae bacterium]|nr:hypothetical protein [Balneolaceae bacterium]